MFLRVKKGFFIFKKVWVAPHPHPSATPSQTAGVVGSGHNFSLSLSPSLSSFYETSKIHPFKKEVEMSKAQSGAPTQRRKLPRGAVKGLWGTRQQVGREEGQTVNTQVWSNNLCINRVFCLWLCTSLTRHLSWPRSSVPMTAGDWAPIPGAPWGLWESVTWRVEHGWKVSLLWGEELRSPT